MKHLLFLALCWASLSFAQAQTTDSTATTSKDTTMATTIDTTTNRDTVYIRDTVRYDTTIIRSFSLGLGESDDRVYTRFLMLDFGLSTYLHNGSINMPADLEAMDQDLWGSKNWTLHVIRQRVSLDKRQLLNISYGISFDFNRYRFTNDQRMLPEQEVVTFTENPDESLRRNQLRATYMTVPVLMTVKFKPKDTRRYFRLSVGAYGGVLVGSRYKYRSNLTGREKISDDFNLNRFRYGLSARLGHGWFNVYVNYGLNSLFESSEQGIYDLRPLNFGVALIPF